jgi:hypothetical protein
MATSLAVPASRNGIPTKVVSNNGVVTNPAYFSRGASTTHRDVVPVRPFGRTFRQQVAGTQTPSPNQAQGPVNVSSRNQNNVTAALLPVNAKTPAYRAAVSGATGGAIVGIGTIKGVRISTEISRGTPTGGYQPFAPSTPFNPNAGVNPAVRKSIIP